MSTKNISATGYFYTPYVPLQSTEPIFQSTPSSMTGNVYVSNYDYPDFNYITTPWVNKSTMSDVLHQKDVLDSVQRVEGNSKIYWGKLTKKYYSNLKCNLKIDGFLVQILSSSNETLKSLNSLDGAEIYITNGMIKNKEIIFSMNKDIDPKRITLECVYEYKVINKKEKKKLLIEVIDL